LQGLSLSGADENESQTLLIDRIKCQYPMDCEEVFVASDTWAPLFTANSSGKLHSVSPFLESQKRLVLSIFFSEIKTL